MAWRVARSVQALQRQLKAEVPNAAPPRTSAASWGTIGDTSHNSTSDHAPKDFPGWGNDIVTAGDQPHAPALGLDQGRVTEALRHSRDPRIKYVIFNRRIFSSYATSTRAAWTWGRYSNAAADPHNDHSHVSVVGDARADGEQQWATGYTSQEATMTMSRAEELWLRANASAVANLEETFAVGDGAGQPVPFTVAFKTLVADVAVLKARTVVLSDADRTAIVDGVLLGLGGRDADVIAATLLSALGPDKARKVGELLAAGPAGA